MWGRKCEAPGVQTVTAECIRQRICIEGAERVRVGAGSPRTSSVSLAVRIHGGQVILGARIGTVARRDRSATAEGDDAPIRVQISYVAVPEGWRRDGLAHLPVLRRSLALVVYEKEQLVLLNWAAERDTKGVANEPTRFVRQSRLQLCCLIEEVICMAEGGAVVFVPAAVQAVSPALGHQYHLRP